MLKCTNIPKRRSRNSCCSWSKGFPWAEVSGARSSRPVASARAGIAARVAASAANRQKYLRVCMVASPPVSEVVHRLSARPWGAVFSQRLPLLVAQAQLAKILDLFLWSQDIEIGSEKESPHADSPHLRH